MSPGKCPNCGFQLALKNERLTVNRGWVDGHIETETVDWVKIVYCYQCGETPNPPSEETPNPPKIARPRIPPAAETAVKYAGIGVLQSLGLVLFAIFWPAVWVVMIVVFLSLFIWLGILTP